MTKIQSHNQCRHYCLCPRIPWSTQVDTLQKLGPVTFNVELNNGRTVKRHLDQLHNRKDTSAAISTPVTTISDIDIYPYSPPEDTTVSQTTTELTTTNPATMEPPERYYPLRQRQPPDRLTLILDTGRRYSIVDFELYRL